MKIGYDGKRAIRNYTGLGNYSRLIIETMSEAYPDSDHLVYAPDMRRNPRLEKLLQCDNVKFRYPQRYWAYPKALWRSWGMTTQARKDGVEVFHGLSNELPFNIHLSPMASVVTIHDVIYRRMPEGYSLLDRRIYDWKYGYSVRHADRVIAISESTKRDVMELYKVPEERIEVIYQGCAPEFFIETELTERRRVRDRLGLPPRYLLQVGTIEKRKNLETTIKALSSLPEEIHLVVVGKGKSYLKEMKNLSEQSGVLQRILFLDNVPFAELPALYRMSLAAVYPSRYEGFGIPVLEALASGTPVITGNVSSLPEAGGDAAFLIAPDDVRGLADAVRAIQAGGSDIEARKYRGQRHAAKFSADTIADKIMECYRTAIKTKAKQRK